MYKRKQNTNSKTVNLCNQFLVIHLQKMIRHSSYSYSQSSYNSHRSQVYYSAINSIRKYPLPIICGLQLKNISGIGDHLQKELEGVIAHHYRSFMKEPGKYKFDIVKPFEENPEQSQRHAKVKSQGCFSEVKEEFQLNNNSCSVKSMIVARTYKPRPNTLAAYFLQALKKISPNYPSDFTNEPLINHTLFTIYHVKNTKGLKEVKENLERHGFIECSGEDTKLTQKGSQFAQTLEEKTKFKDTKLKIMGVIDELKEKASDQKEQVEEQIVKTTLFKQKQKELVLLVDCREIKDKSEQDYFCIKLMQKHKVACQSAALPLGDFIWMYDGNVLDFIIERKKADDLASSIIDGRYRQQKYRLKKSGIGNVQYLYEGHPSNSSQFGEKELGNALLKTCIKDGFKVIKTRDINHSIQYLAFMHTEINSRLQTMGIKSIGTLKEFNLRNSKKSNLTVEMIFGLSLKSIPGVGSHAVNSICKYFQTFKEMYDKLSQFPNRNQRIHFLKELFKGSGVRYSLAPMLVDFFFKADYKQIDQVQH